MIWAIILAFLAMLIGLAGVVMPFIPGVPVAWLGLFGFAYYTHFAVVSGRAVWIFTGLMLLSFLVDFFAPLLAARLEHASRYGMFGAFWGTIAGVALVGPFGVVVGPFFGALLGELYAGKPLQQAYRAALGALAGFLVGSAVKALIIASMIVYLAAVLLF